MPTHVTSGDFVLAAVRIAVILAGVIVWWKSFRRVQGSSWQMERLAPWWISGIDFSYFALATVMGWLTGSFVFSLLMHTVFPNAAKDQDLLLVVVGSGTEVGVIAGILAYRSILKRKELAGLSEQPPRVTNSTVLPLGKSLLAGFVTYLAAIPSVMIVTLGWQAILDYFHIPRPLQDSVALFGQTHDPIKIGILGVAAVLVAPIAEELVFRAGLFRYFRTRIPRWLAFLIPSALFGAAHTNLNAFVPLLVLALMLSLAYERSGRIVTPMLAHALFNLTSVVLILSGVDL